MQVLAFSSEGPVIVRALSAGIRLKKLSTFKAELM
jgi:hypothetical protein